MEILQIDDKTVCVSTKSPLITGAEMRLIVSRQRGGKVKKALCTGIAEPDGEPWNKPADRNPQSNLVYRISYKPVSALNEYLMARHVLRLTVY